MNWNLIVFIVSWHLKNINMCVCVCVCVCVGPTISRLWLRALAAPVVVQGVKWSWTSLSSFSLQDTTSLTCSHKCWIHIQNSSQISKSKMNYRRNPGITFPLLSTQREKRKWWLFLQHQIALNSKRTPAEAWWHRAMFWFYNSFIIFSSLSVIILFIHLIAVLVH